MSEENKTLVHHTFTEIWNRGNFSVIDENLAHDFINHTPFGEMHGLEGARQFGEMLRTAFPDLRATVEDQIAEGDGVATRWTARGTHQGEFQGISATGKQMEITVMTISRIANGKLVEQWGNPDLLGLMQQLGVVPVPGQAG